MKNDIITIIINLEKEGILKVENKCFLCKTNPKMNYKEILESLNNTNGPFIFYTYDCKKCGHVFIIDKAKNQVFNDHIKSDIEKEKLLPQKNIDAISAITIVKSRPDEPLIILSDGDSPNEWRKIFENRYEKFEILTVSGIIDRYNDFKFER